MRLFLRLALVTLGVLACGPDKRELALAAKVSDSLTVAFADSVASRVPAPPPPKPLAATDSLRACDDPVGAGELTEVQTGILAMALPKDFIPIDTARRNLGVYRWIGRPDYATLVVRSGVAQYHSGWTGLLTSECTIEVAGATAHIDLADAGAQVPDFVVRAVLERPGMYPFVFEAHTRNVRRQGELLHVLRTLSIADSGWVSNP
jgi:hypothetical protein